LVRYPLFIGLRYLRAKRQEAFISLITVIATAGVAIGVMTLNVVLSVMTGFEEDLRDRILGFNPHVLVLSYSGRIEDYEPLLERLREVPGVVAAAPFVYGQGMVSTPDLVVGALLRGVDPGSEQTVDFRRHLVRGDAGDLDTLHPVRDDAAESNGVRLPGVVLGKELARRLGVDLGDAVSFVSPAVIPTLVGMVPRVKRFVVVGLFESGMSEYDGVLAYVNLANAQRFFQLGGAVTGFEIRTADLYQAARVGDEIEGRVEFPYYVRDWMELNHTLFSALTLEKTVYFVVLLLIVLVAAFNIVAMLVMVVMEKRKDIAILKSLGATRAGIAAIFLSKGLAIAAVGTLLGNLAGYAVCWALGRYEFDLPPGVFYVSSLPVRVYPGYFALVTAASLAICLLAALYPARQAAALDPVEIIRYE
jgi:lipoprotein-releasing system permease protein